MSGQEEKQEQRKSFFEENGRLLVELDDFLTTLQVWTPVDHILSNDQQLALAYALGVIDGIGSALAALDNSNKALEFLYNRKNIKEFSELVDAVERYHYRLVRGEVKDPEGYLWEFGLLVDSFVEFMAKAIKSIKTQSPFDR
jgi:hypothetical protein